MTQAGHVKLYRSLLDHPIFTLFHGCLVVIAVILHDSFSELGKLDAFRRKTGKPAGYYVAQPPFQQPFGNALVVDRVLWPDMAAL